LLLFLTVVTFATSATFGAAFLSVGRNLAIAGFCVLVIVAGRRLAGVLHERSPLWRSIVVHRQRTLSIRSHQAALAELKRARHLVDAAQPSSGHFVAMMSHEIRRPLRWHMATIDMLRDEPLSPVM
jgi:signal transduction histidine kinase